MHLIDSVVPDLAVTQTEDARTMTSVRDCRPKLRPSVEGRRRPTAWITGLLLAGALSACADQHSYEQCGSGSGGCSGDANVTANVQGALAQHPELEGPDQLYVKTIDHVVYLSGTVETGLHRDTAASVAGEVNGVTRVVNNIAIEK
jgi:hypothetical protein